MNDAFKGKVNELLSSSDIDSSVGEVEHSEHQVVGVHQIRRDHREATLEVHEQLPDHRVELARRALLLRHAIRAPVEKIY